MVGSITPITEEIYAGTGIPGYGDLVIPKYTYSAVDYRLPVAFDS
jgi:hypothetical protein